MKPLYELVELTRKTSNGFNHANTLLVTKSGKCNRVTSVFSFNSLPPCCHCIRFLPYENELYIQSAKLNQLLLGIISAEKTHLKCLYDFAHFSYDDGYSFDY